MHYKGGIYTHNFKQLFLKDTEDFETLYNSNMTTF